MRRAPKYVVVAAAAALVLPALASAQMMDNAALQAKVKTKLMTDDFMEGAGINLETSDGVVQLGEACDNGFNEDAYLYAPDACGTGCTVQVAQVGFH